MNTAALPLPAGLLPRLLAILRRQWWAVAAGAAIGLLGGIVAINNSERLYNATLRVAPAPSSQGSTGLGGLSGLASSLAGVTIGEPATPFRLYVEGLSSRTVAERLATDEDLMHRLFRTEWNARARRWQEPDSVGEILRRSLLGLLGAPVPAWRPPDAARLQAWLIANVGVDQTPKTPLVTLSVDAPDPAFAARLLLRIDATIDGWLRERTLDRTRRNIAWLLARAPTIAVAEHRQALYATLADQEQQLMQARNPAPYAAERFEAVMTSTGPVSPRPFRLLGLGLVLGALLGSVVALAVGWRRA